MRSALLAALLVLLAAAPVGAEAPGDEADLETPQAWGAFTRYELLDPASAKFRITYDVTDARPGARAFYNPIRKGSTASEESVVDLATGAPLAFRTVDGATARAEGEVRADPGSDYIRVAYAHPAPPGGAVRFRILKTYEDAASYRSVPGGLAFDRSFGIRRNEIILPRGWRLTSMSYPAQVGLTADGRVRVELYNVTPAEAPVAIRAAPGALGGGVGAETAPLRAEQTRDIVYDLKPPQTHAFFLFHDYTEARPGVSRYVNVVRAGSTPSGPSGRLLDDGAPLEVQVLAPGEVRAAGLTAEELGPGYAGEAVVLFRFPPPPPGGSRRLRLRETYTDPAGYGVSGDELVFRRTFGRAANAVVLPAGWELAFSSAAARISRTPSGRVRLDLENPTAGELAVEIRARRPGGAAATP